MKIFRAKILNPLSAEKCDFFEDGGLSIENGRISALGSFAEIFARFPNAEVVEEKGLIMPAFSDVHLHWVQNPVKGSFRNELLPWLKEHIWPEEEKYADFAYAKKMLATFWEELKTVGTGNAMVYSSVHFAATEIALDEAKNHGHVMVGNVLMDQNSPPELQMAMQEELDISEVLANTFPKNYVVTPRFAPTCSMEIMKKAAKIAEKYGCFVQTHLAENVQEIEWVQELFPEQKNYTEVYADAGLLGEKTVLGHCIHLSDAEWSIVKASGSKIAHCPSSNLALNNGRMPLEKVREYGIDYALGSDIGAGPELSMFDVMRKFVRVHREAGVEVTAIEAFYRATLAGAEIMGVADVAGNFGIGKEAAFLSIPYFSEAKEVEEFLEAFIHYPVENVKLISLL